MKESEKDELRSEKCGDGRRKMRARGGRLGSAEGLGVCRVEGLFNPYRIGFLFCFRPREAPASHPWAEGRFPVGENKLCGGFFPRAESRVWSDNSVGVRGCVTVVEGGLGDAALPGLGEVFGTQCEKVRSEKEELGSEKCGDGTRNMRKDRGSAGASPHRVFQTERGRRCREGQGNSTGVPQRGSQPKFWKNSSLVPRRSG
jgi:hypothetical protein